MPCPESIRTCYTQQAKAWTGEPARISPFPAIQICQPDTGLCQDTAIMQQSSFHKDRLLKCHGLRASLYPAARYRGYGKGVFTVPHLVSVPLPASILYIQGTDGQFYFYVYPRSIHTACRPICILPPGKGLLGKRDYIIACPI